MADGNAKISENAINAGAVINDVGTFSGTISGNNIGGSQNSIHNSSMASESE